MRENMDQNINIYIVNTDTFTQYKGFQASDGWLDRWKIGTMFLLKRSLEKATQARLK